MTELELKHLRRADLVEILLDLSKENEILRAQLERARTQLADRTIAVENAGSLAEAALRLNGVFEAATIHYAVAKIFGPLLFGRGWCGYACWTAMVLDLLPYKSPVYPRKKFGFIRYITFALSFLFVASLFILRAGNMEKIMFWCFLLGNILYYAVGIILAYRLKDNRAFCKYICPITVFLKPLSRYSAMRITCDTSICISCGACKKVCPMDVDMTDNTRSRINGTECILCMECVQACPKQALKL